MTRRRSPKRRDWRMTLFLIVSLVIVLTMVLGTVFIGITGPN